MDRTRQQPTIDAGLPQDTPAPQRHDGRGDTINDAFYRALKTYTRWREEQAAQAEDPTNPPVNVAGPVKVDAVARYISQLAPTRWDNINIRRLLAERGVRETPGLAERFEKLGGTTKLEPVEQWRPRGEHAQSDVVPLGVAGARDPSHFLKFSAHGPQVPRLTRRQVDPDLPISRHDLPGKQLSEGDMGAMSTVLPELLESQVGMWKMPKTNLPLFEDARGTWLFQQALPTSYEELARMYANFPRAFRHPKQTFDDNLNRLRARTGMIIDDVADYQPPKNVGYLPNKQGVIERKIYDFGVNTVDDADTLTRFLRRWSPVIDKRLQEQGSDLMMRRIVD